MSETAFMRISPFIREEDAAKIVPILNERYKEFGIKTRDRMAAFLATIIHESGSFRYKEEIASGEAYEGRKDLGNTEAGDGKRFKGRGFIQITGRYNYQKISDGLHIKAIEKPELLSEYPLCLVSAMWWWQQNGCNNLADTGSIERVTRKVNGGLNGLEDRKKWYEAALKEL